MATVIIPFRRRMRSARTPCRHRVRGGDAVAPPARHRRLVVVRRRHAARSVAHGRHAPQRTSLLRARELDARPSRRAAARRQRRQSMLEDDDQRGIAHFLEHMAFNGTRHFPHADARRLHRDERDALRRRPERVHELRTKPSTCSRCPRTIARFSIAGSRCCATGLGRRHHDRLDRGEGRARGRDGRVAHAPARHGVAALSRSTWTTVLYGDSRYRVVSRSATPTLIETATAAPIRRFYEKWYRPDNMALIVVGDFDRAAMRARDHRSVSARSRPAPRTRARVHASTCRCRDASRRRLRGERPCRRSRCSGPRPRFRHTRATRSAQRIIQHLLYALPRAALPAHPRASIAAVHHRGSRERRRSCARSTLVGVQLIAWPDSLERSLQTVLTEFERVAQHGIPEPALDAREGRAPRPSRARGRRRGRTRRRRRTRMATSKIFSRGNAAAERASRSWRWRVRFYRRSRRKCSPTPRSFWREPAGMRVLISRFPSCRTCVRPHARASLAIIRFREAHPSFRRDESRTGRQARRCSRRCPRRGASCAEKLDRVAGITEWTLSNGARVIVKPSQNDPDELLLRRLEPGGLRRDARLALQHARDAWWRA